MGIRADFYIGRGQDAQWLGSVAWDGYQWEEDPECAIMKAATADEFSAAVAALADRRDFTAPADGWPWPWSDSNTTDYAYVLHDGKVTAYVFGRECIPSAERDEEGDTERGDKVDWFPNMEARQNVQMGEKSGVIWVTA